MANGLTREALGGRYDARSAPRSDGGRRSLLWAGSAPLQRLIGRTRLPYSDRAVRALGLLWLVCIFVAVLWDFLPVR